MKKLFKKLLQKIKDRNKIEIELTGFSESRQKVKKVIDQYLLEAGHKSPYNHE